MAHAPVAQLVEQFPFKEEVGGSNPPGGTLILSTERAYSYLDTYPLTCCQGIYTPAMGVFSFSKVL